jgi:hypothetical protein
MKSYLLYKQLFYFLITRPRPSLKLKLISKYLREVRYITLINKSKCLLSTKPR